MVEPISLGVLGGLLLTEGVKFLYGQASALLERHRAQGDDREVNKIQVSPPVPDTILSNKWQPTEPDDGLVSKIAPAARDLVDSLRPFADGTQTVDPTNSVLIIKIEALRQILEYAFRNEITFAGENRRVDRKRVTGEVDVDQVLGYAAAIRARRDVDADLHGSARANRVEDGATLVGVDLSEPDKK